MKPGHPLFEVLAQRDLERVELLAVLVHVLLGVEAGALHELAHRLDGEAGVEVADERLVEARARHRVAQGSDGVPEPALRGVDLLAVGIALRACVGVEVVEAVDHEAQAPLAVGEVEDLQEVELLGSRVHGLLEELPLLGPAAQHAPGEERVGGVGRKVADGARGLRIAVDDAADLQPDVGRVAEAGAGTRLLLGSLADVRELGIGGVLRDLGQRADDLADPLLDGVPARLDDVADPPDALVQGADLDQVVEDRLDARQAGQPAERGGERRRLRPRGRPERGARVGLEVKKPPVDLHVGGPLPDRLDRRPERLVVEHASVDEPRRGRLELRQLVEPEEPLLEPSEIDGTVLSEPALQRLEADGREDAGDRGGRPRGEGERAVGVVVEVVAAVVAAEAEGQEVPVAPVVDRIRVGIGHLAPVAVEVGHRHEELELVPVGQQRRQRGGRRAVLVHPVEGVVDPPGHQVAAERRFLQRVQRDPDAFQHARRQPSRRCEQAVDVATLEPEIAELVLRQVVRQRLRETHAVDPAGRGAGDHVDDDARPEVLAVSQRQFFEQPPVDALARRGRLAVARLEQGRALDDPVELLRHAVHVDRERRASVADQRQAELFRGDGVHAPRLAP